MRKDNKIKRNPFRAMVGFSTIALPLLPSLCFGESAMRNVSSDSGLTTKPNFLFILTDEQTIDAMSCTGNPYLNTPNMDKLAARGIRFENSSCTYPLSTPSRASLFTSRMPHEIGVFENDSTGDLSKKGVPTLGELFQSAGYETAYSGKWHLMQTYPGLWNYKIPGFSVLPLTFDSNQSIGLYRDSYVADVAISFLKGAHVKPFLLVASILNPHDICDYTAAPSDFMYLNNGSPLPPLLPNYAISPKEPGVLTRWRTNAKSGLYTDTQWQQYRAIYYRLIEQADKQVGRIVDALDKANLTSNTVIIFTSDHGEMMGAHHHERKTMLYREAWDVPLIACVPGITDNGMIDSTHLISNLDIMPTLLDYASIPAPSSLEGVSLRPIIEGKPVVWRDYIFGETEDVYFMRAVRSDRYKYIKYVKSTNPEQFFDLQKDPFETQNLIDNSTYKTVIDSYRLILNDWIVRTNDLSVMTSMENVKSNTLTLYPNPSNGIFQISPSFESLNNAKITVRNANGQVVYKSVLQDQSDQIDLRPSGKGLFFMQLNIDDNHYISKIMIF